jgi:hypothetical protein
MAYRTTGNRRKKAYYVRKFISPNNFPIYHLLKKAPKFPLELDLTATGVTPMPFASAVVADNWRRSEVEVTSMSLCRDTAVDSFESKELDEVSALV